MTLQDVKEGVLDISETVLDGQSAYWMCPNCGTIHQTSMYFDGSITCNKCGNKFHISPAIEAIP